ncbi:hypothetical protein Syun_004555 [Stephania yunnanensis]|uniref:Uncharacterized protein n=1 Tax=Stephania yunnanensis TaxID=152371 RepID=A0AAP0L4N7_9MAGN
MNLRIFIVREIKATTSNASKNFTENIKSKSNGGKMVYLDSEGCVSEKECCINPSLKGGKNHHVLIDYLKTQCLSTSISPPRGIPVSREDPVTSLGAKNKRRGK